MIATNILAQQWFHFYTAGCITGMGLAQLILLITDWRRKK